MPRCLISLGSNLGDRRAMLDRAVELLRQNAQFQDVKASRWRETAPAGGPPGQSNFLNGAATLQTSLPPLEVLSQLQSIEGHLGRTRESHWGPRTLDLDLLLYGDKQIELPTLVVPHPRMAFRRFVLEPATEVAGDMPFPPIRGWSVATLLAHLNHSPRYLAIAGVPGCGKTQLAQALAGEPGIRYLPDPAARILGDLVGPATRVAAFQREREILASRQQALAQATWPHDERWTITDFAWRQSLAYASQHGSGAELAELEQAFVSADPDTQHPRLTILLEGASAGPLSIALRRRLNWGPVLRLPARELGGNVAEAHAALAAMR